MEPLQAIIDHNKMRLFNITQENESQMIRVLDKIEGSSAQTFEFRSLESILAITAETLEEEFREIAPLLDDILDNVTKERNPQNLWELREISDRVEEFESTVLQSLKAINTVLANDEDMAMMYLTNAHAGIRQPVSEHAEVETMLESFVEQLQELENSAIGMRNRIVNAEQYMRILADSQRNRIIKTNLYVSLATLAVSTSALGAGIFGMNLINGFENDPNAFMTVCVSLGAVMIVTNLIGVYIAMYGSGDKIVRRRKRLDYKKDFKRR